MSDLRTIEVDRVRIGAVFQKKSGALEMTVLEEWKLQNSQKNILYSRKDAN